MKTNSKQVREKIRLHILDCVTDDKGNTYYTFQEAAARLRSEFDRVANHPHNIHRFPVPQDRFHDYLMGIPFDFEFMNHRITGITGNQSHRERIRCGEIRPSLHLPHF